MVVWKHLYDAIEFSASKFSFVIVSETLPCERSKSYFLQGNKIQIKEDKFKTREPLGHTWGSLSSWLPFTTTMTCLSLSFFIYDGDGNYLQAAQAAS